MAKRRDGGKSSTKKTALKKRAADLASSKPGARLTPIPVEMATAIRREVRSATRQMTRTLAPQLISSLRNSDWLGPQQPVTPIVSEGASDFRTWDYPPGYNVNFQPRKYLPYTAQQLQWLADSFDLLREVIENRKNEVVKLEWDIVGRDGEDTDEVASKAIKEFLRFPDGVHPYSTWLRMVLEDMYVIDAATLYPWPKRNGDLYRLEVISGATINPLIDGTGRLPDPPDPAYQQIIRGTPYQNFTRHDGDFEVRELTREELIYFPRNLRPYTPIYGYSQVEQVVVSIAIGIKAEMAHLYYYTQGTIPDVLISVPDSWSPQNIAKFQAWFDALMRGNLQRRMGGVLFVPGGLKAEAMKDYKFSPEMWEWLARMVCACFHVSPQPYIKQVNRATAETAHVEEIQEALESEKEWVAALMNLIIARYFRRPDLQFHWKEDSETDILEAAQADNMRVRGGMKSINEVREAAGDDPTEGGDEPFVVVGNQVVLVKDIGKMSEVAVTPKPAPIMAKPGTKPGAKPGTEPAKDGNETGTDPETVGKSALNGRHYQERDGWLIPMDVL